MKAAKDKAAQEYAFNSFDEALSLCGDAMLNNIIDRAMELYAEQKAVEFGCWLNVNPCEKDALQNYIENRYKEFNK